MSAAEDWESATPAGSDQGGEVAEVVPFEQIFDLPRFPVEAMPAGMGAYVQAAADELSVAPELVAVSTLAVVSAAVCGRLEVQLKPGRVEPTNLYLAGMAGSGDLKSPIQKRVMRPLWKAQADLRELTASNRGRERVAKELAEHRAQQALAACAKGDGDAEAAGQLRAAADALVVTATPQLVGDDVSAESLRDLVIAQQGRIAIVAAEGNLIEVLAGRYSNAPNLEYLLKGHAGEPFIVDRVGGKGHQECARTAITVGLLVQPDVVAAMLNIPGAVERGLVGRFLIFHGPSSVAEPWDTPMMDPAVERAHHRTIEAMVAQFWRREHPVLVECTPAAEKRLAHFHDEVVARRDSGDLAVVAPWARKLVGHTARLAALFATYEAAGPAPAEDHHAEGAEAIAQVAIAHYLHAVRLRRDPADAELQADARHLRAWSQHKGAASFTKREACKDVGWKAARVQAALDELAERGYVRLRWLGHGSIEATVVA